MWTHRHRTCLRRCPRSSYRRRGKPLAARKSWRGRAKTFCPGQAMKRNNNPAAAKHSSRQPSLLIRLLESASFVFGLLLRKKSPLHWYLLLEWGSPSSLSWNLCDRALLWCVVCWSQHILFGGVCAFFIFFFFLQFPPPDTEAENVSWCHLSVLTRWEELAFLRLCNLC